MVDVELYFVVPHDYRCNGPAKKLKNVFYKNAMNVIEDKHKSDSNEDVKYGRSGFWNQNRKYRKGKV